ncbi:hypothetical protein EM20IM_08200 [Candidatus Methylacidiphilum infernorum]|uniref:Uncharacterized protein n=1 Tax=Candidatus Methylacidiphilum infernorum TaxID=511746 RepID=A0ABX7PTZ5_9BACT|nr:DUF6607 family protein [Candidatus Methylacidiphilum infernorum]QSR86466.1 hypothetical protein EM20IM_08200 [Candidatus Methylacidiphilum infernorum]
MFPSFLLLFFSLGLIGLSALPLEDLKKDVFTEDRRAILSMVGNWRVSYRFKEIFSFHPSYILHPSYRIKGYEKVLLLEDKDRHISLQHLLVDPNGMVIKHWREDWDYEKLNSWSYEGNNRWESVVLDPALVKGCWVQMVWNVDDAPRYAGYGRWIHLKDYSEWTSSRLGRPLPRREQSRRSDYNLMESIMHQLVWQQGWIIQEENDKWVYNPSERFALAREIGVIIYEKEQKLDFSPADRYMQKTADFWQAVRSVWKNIFDEYRQVQYKRKESGRKLAEKLTEEAQRYDSKAVSGENLQALIFSWIKEHYLLIPGKAKNEPSL